MLNESIPTASASTASSTVLRMRSSPLSWWPDSPTLMGTNESNPNSMSLVVITVSSLPVFLQSIADPSGRSRGGRRRHPEELAELVDHEIPALHLRDGLAPYELVLSGELTRPA